MLNYIHLCQSNNNKVLKIFQFNENDSFYLLLSDTCAASCQFVTVSSCSQRESERVRDVESSMLLIYSADCH